MAKSPQVKDHVHRSDWGTDAGSGSVTVLEGDGAGCEGEVVRTVTILATSNMDEAPWGRFHFLRTPPVRPLCWVRPTPAGQVEVVLFDILVPK